MSLDTVLKIGKALSKSKDNLKYFKYIEPCPVKKEKDRSKTYPICITIPVNEDFSFNWEGVNLTPENKKDKLFYLKFKTSDSDSSPNKYLFGDISYSRKNGLNKKGRFNPTKDFGNFTLERGNAFENAQNVLDQIKENIIKDIFNEEIEKYSDKNREIIIKQFKIAYETNTEKINVPKKLLKETEHLQTIYDKQIKKIAKNILFKYTKKFKNEQDKITKILMYAPVIQYFIENNQFTENILDDNLKIKYAEYLSENLNPRILKNFLSKDGSIDKISNETLTKISKYCDFNVFIHFDFKGKSWTDFKGVTGIIFEKLNTEIADTTEYGKVPSKTIYRTLCSGNEKNDIQFPNFDLASRFKSFYFKENDFTDFLHAGRFINKPLRNLKDTDIEFYILPVPLNTEKEFSAEQYEDFLISQDEARMKIYDENNDEETLFIFTEVINKNFSKFDFIFTDGSGKSKNDLIEISGIEQSRLKTIASRINKKSNEVKSEKQKFLHTKKEQYSFKIENAFKNLLGSYLYDENTKKINIKPNPKYQTHLLKVIPQIYTENYFNDEVLLPSFIQNIEYSVRNLSSDKDLFFKYVDLKFNLMFLMKIRNNKNDIYMEVTNSKSYQIGLKMGKLAKPLKKAINSFEKNYIGLISRRVTSLNDCILFLNEIDEKLIMHGKTWAQMSAEVRNELSVLPLSDYDKEKLIFGFFEGYFKYEAKDRKADFYKNLDKLYANNKDNEELKEEVEQLQNLIENIKQ